VSAYSIEQFNERLEETFGRRLRLRRSHLRESTLFVEEFAAEERTLARLIAELPVKSTRQARNRADDYTRARDGYRLFMEVQTGTRSACVRCGHAYRVPEFKVVQLRCPTCDYDFATSFFPIGESLLDYLKMCDPDRVDQVRRVREEEAREEWLKKCDERSLAKDAGEAFRDTLIEQIPAARLSGQTQMWIQE